MKIINLFGSSGSGKSTTALGLAYNLKIRGKKVELVTEYAKTLVFSGCEHLLANQLHVFSEQNFRMKIREDKGLDFLVTDSPLLLASFYGGKYNVLSKELERLIHKEFDSYENINFFLNRTVTFDPTGRVQTEAESDKDSQLLQGFLIRNNVSYETHESNDSLAGYLAYKILTNY